MKATDNSGTRVSFAGYPDVMVAGSFLAFLVDLQRDLRGHSWRSVLEGQGTGRLLGIAHR